MRVKFMSFLFLFIMAIIWSIPVIWSIFSSFKEEIEIMTRPESLLPTHWVVTNYSTALFDTSTPVFKWFLNSLFISIVHTILVVVIVALASYGYTRLHFKGRDTLFVILLGTMMFPSVVNLIPLYKIVDLFGWVNTSWAMIVPGAASVFNIFLVRQFMGDIPREFDESAKMDGANDFQIFIHVLLPLIKPVLTVVALFAFTASWNDFLWPSIVFNDIDKMPLTPGLQLLQGTYDQQKGLLLAGAVFALIPTFLLYLFTQRYFLQSLSMSSGVKG